MTKYIFITGGVVSGLGKGITAASLGRLLKARGYKVTALKFNPYFNIDTTNLSPHQHGEIYVTEDGREGDLVLGHYERIMDENLSSRNDVTSGEIYSSVIAKERANLYNGVAVQVVPHITDEIKQRVFEMGKTDADIVITEIGGTVGDIETHPFIEAVRQAKSELGKANVAYIHVTLVPYIEVSGEQKTKPTQHSVKDLQNLGIQPDILVCRSDYPLGADSKNKLALFCNVDKSCIIENLVAPNLYGLPLTLEKEGLATAVLKKLGLEEREPELASVADIAARCERVSHEDKAVRVALIGRYVEKYDAFLSVREALILGGFVNNVNVEIVGIASDSLNETNVKDLNIYDGVVLPAGFGAVDFENKQIPARFCRENDIPLLMMGMGAQAGIMEYSAAVGINNFEPIILSMRKGQPYFKKGAFNTRLNKNSRLREIYGRDLITERHHHRRQINPEIVPLLKNKGLIISGKSSDGEVDSFELPEKRFYIGVMFRPELTSRPEEPSKLFAAFIKSCLK